MIGGHDDHDADHPGASERDGDWVFEGNLRAFMDGLAHAVGYEFDDRDWTAVEHALFKGEDADERVLDYPLEGHAVARLRLLFEPGDSAVCFELRADPATIAQARTLTYLAQSYDITQIPH